MASRAGLVGDVGVPGPRRSPLAARLPRARSRPNVVLAPGKVRTRVRDSRARRVEGFDGPEAVPQDLAALDHLAGERGRIRAQANLRPVRSLVRQFNGAAGTAPRKTSCSSARCLLVLTTGSRRPGVGPAPDSRRSVPSRPGSDPAGEGAPSDLCGNARQGESLRALSRAKPGVRVGRPRFTRESGSSSGVECSIPAVERRGFNRVRAPPSFLTARTPRSELAASFSLSRRRAA